MTNDQALTEVRKALAMDERLASLIQQVAKAQADDDLRRTYDQLDHPALLRLTGAAAGVEDFVQRITAAPNKPDRK